MRDQEFVRTEVSQVNDKVTTMGKSLEETQERVRVDRRADHRGRCQGGQAGQAAQVATRTPPAAQQTGTQAMEVGKTADCPCRGRRGLDPQADLEDRPE